jgi:arylsulfatase A-like enzyme
MMIRMKDPSSIGNRVWRLGGTAWCLFAGLMLQSLNAQDSRSPLVSPSKPNIVWIIVDDMSANLSCYGETVIETPHLDQLASSGIKFTQAFVTAPVCSTNRSAFITGMYQTAIGSHHHRSGRGEMKIHLPDGVRPIPEYFQEAGYYTAITGWPNKDRTNSGKTDYNFEWDRSMYDGPDWSERKQGQPFFAQVQLPGGKHRGGDIEASRKFVQRMKEEFGTVTDPGVVTLPPYYPDDSILLEDWAAYLDTVRLTDKFVGDVIARLKEEGDFENTVVLFMTDHGISHARGKQFLYEEGIHVPLIIAGPGLLKGEVRTDLVEHIDIAALSLGLAGIEIPGYMQAKDILSEDYKERTAIFSARDRCDETVEHMRCVRTDRYKYIRNFLPNRPHMQPNRYKDGKSIIVALREANEAGTLNGVQASIFNPTRPKEELYDLQNDPFEIRNLADDPNYRKQLKDLRRRLDSWIEATGDRGPESEGMYDSDMAVYLKSRGSDPEQLQVLRRNIKQMKAWAAEGK